MELLMNKGIYWFAGWIVFIALVLNAPKAFAHEDVTVGDYEFEIGWVDEPPIVGQQNAVLVNVVNTSGGEPQPVKDVSSLTVTISYGGQTKPLTLQPQGEDTPGQFMAPILITVPGQYTVILGGRLGDTDIRAEAEPEEVATSETLQFPDVSSKGQGTDPGILNWLVYLSLLIALLALVLAMMALRRAR